MVRLFAAEVLTKGLRCYCFWPVSMTPERWHRITDIAHAAREHGPAGRTAFVSQVCDGDVQLRLEVDAMLAANDHDQ